MAQWQPRYKSSNGKKWIEVRVRSPMQLFDAKDPAPFRERDLDDDFVEYVVSSMREFSHKTPVRIVIYIDDAQTEEISVDSIREAIGNFFSYKTGLYTGDLKGFLRRAQMFFAVGIVALIACLWTAQQLGDQTSEGLLGILREGIVILGWVSMWKPIELLLFDWYPIYEQIRIYKKLQNTEVDVILREPQIA